MKNMRLVAFVVFAVGVLCLPALAQEKWTYEGSQGGYYPAAVTVIITRTPSGYAVSGRIKSGKHYCALRGTYVPKTERLEATGDCQGGYSIPQMLKGRKMKGRDALQITEPWSFVAYRVGLPQRTSIPNVIKECEQYGGSICGTWTIRGNQIDAVWDNGAKAVLVIEKFDYDQVVFTRRDTAASVSKGFSARYTGKVSGNKVVDGVVTWTNNGKSWSGTWTASW